MTIDAPLLRQVPELRKLWQEAFGDTDAFLDGFYHTAFSTDRCRCVTVDDRVASAVYWFDCSCDGHRVAYLYALATAKAHRGRGLGRKLMEHVHELLTSQGYETVLLVPGEESLRRYYEAMGYRTCTTFREFECTGGPEDLQCRSVSAAEYGRLRRERLPEGAVLQEKESLDFLALQAKFYAGSDFLLAARKQEQTLFGLELLGNPNLAPAILRSLGCCEGTFRIPGGEEPFAMALPLKPGAVIPRYFAFAFD